MITVLQGDARAMLRTLEPGSAHVCVTSLPYYGLRSYGTEPQVWGGQPGHDEGFNHRWNPDWSVGGKQDVAHPREVSTGQHCSCGAWLGELGLEPTPELYVQHVLEVFREVKRVLHPTGTLWLNCGDSYAGSGKGPSNSLQPDASQIGSRQQNGQVAHGQAPTSWIPVPRGLKPKDLLGMPWRLAFALQADGWYWRSTIVWAKKACMPESVRDRPTNAWEPSLLFSKNSRYFYDAEAVREESEQDEHNQRYAKPYDFGLQEPCNGQPNNTNHVGIHSRPGPGGRNMRNVWHLGPEPLRDEHYAVFVTEIPRRAILAGTSEKGCCPACKAPWQRVTQPTVAYAKRLEEAKTWGSWYASANNADLHDVTVDGRTYQAKHGKPYQSSTSAAYETTSWRASCSCDAGPPVPAIVLDPFLGSGTTAMVADRLGRDCVGIELKPEYVTMARNRITRDAPLFVQLAEPLEYVQPALVDEP